VSHDRYFLDRVTNRTLELFHGTIDSYTGNFSAYWRQKADRLLVQRRTYERQQEEIAKAEEFIRRHQYGQKHAQAEDRRKKLERIVPVDPPREITAPVMGFPPSDRSGDIVVRAEGVAKAYDRSLFRELSFDLIRGQRWGILGPNGCGKTTLLRCLVGQETPDKGQIAIGQGVTLGYFDQQLNSLSGDDRAVDAIRPPDRDFEEPKRRSLLARFGITGDTALQKVGSLSGGEQCRAALARLAALEANFLVLDEPTNHLDLWARDALERSLRDFQGTVIFVSHDRYFVNQVADHLLVVEPGRFRVIEGNYASYQTLVQSGAAAGQAETKHAAQAKSAKTSKSTGDGNRTASEKKPTRKRQFAFRKVSDIEADILEREQKVEELHRLLTVPETLRDGERVRQIKIEIVQEQETLQTLYAHWEEAVELNW
jgi:ATP-binding cassette subfamily F protein 3